MTTPEWRPNGAKRRRAPALSRQQRVMITLVAAVCGLLFAYAVQSSGQRRARAAAAAADPQLPGVAGAAVQQQQRHAASRKVDTAAHKKAEAKPAGGKHGAMKAAGAQPHQQAAGQTRGKQGQHKPAAQLPGMEDEGEWFAKLSSQACARAVQLRVCSHRGRLAVEGVPAGSLSAYSVLHKGGISCFDTDFVATRDGQLVASHPDDLRAALGGQPGGAQPLGELSLAELRAAGADEERFPTADALIKVFAALLEESGLLWKASKGQQAPDYEELPVLLMDLKGEAYCPAAINSVAAAAQAVGAQAHVVLFVSGPDQLALVRNQTGWGGPLIKSYLDQQDPSPELTDEQLAPYTLLGPSIKMADAFFAAAARLSKPVLAWTVDSPVDLHRALEAGLNAVISNSPLAVRGVLLDWRDRCSERQGRLRERRRALHARQHNTAP